MSALIKLTQIHGDQFDSLFVAVGIPWQLHVVEITFQRTLIELVVVVRADCVLRALFEYI
jgi:hypothetical protein